MAVIEGLALLTRLRMYGISSLSLTLTLSLAVSLSLSLSRPCVPFSITTIVSFQIRVQEPRRQNCMERQP